MDQNANTKSTLVLVSRVKTQALVRSWKWEGFHAIVHQDLKAIDAKSISMIVRRTNVKITQLALMGSTHISVNVNLDSRLVLLESMNINGKINLLNFRVNIVKRRCIFVNRINRKQIHAKTVQHVWI